MIFMDFFIIKVNVNFIFNEIDLWVIGIYMYDINLIGFLLIFIYFYKSFWILFEI